MSSIYDIAGTTCDCFSINGKVNILQGDNDPLNTQGQNGDVYFQSVGTIWSKKNDIWQKVESAFADFGIPTKDNQIVTVSPSETGIDIKYLDITSPELGDFGDVVYRSKNNTIIGNNTFSGNNSFSGDNIFTGTNTFTKTIMGTAYEALWADIAEKYTSDIDYPKGTLVQFGGEKEITIAKTEVNAVISDKPGYILNSKEKGLPIVLAGKTKIRCLGKINKFDKLVLSEIPGLASKKKFFDGKKVIAIALETNYNEDEKLVMCVTKLEF